MGLGLSFAYADAGVLSLAGAVVSGISLPVALGVASLGAACGLILTNSNIVPFVKDMYYNHLSTLTSIKEIDWTNIEVTEQLADDFNFALDSYRFGDGYVFGNQSAWTNGLALEITLSQLNLIPWASKPNRTSATYADFSNFATYGVNGVPGLCFAVTTNGTNSGYIYFLNTYTKAYLGATIWSYTPGVVGFALSQASSTTATRYDITVQVIKNDGTTVSLSPGITVYAPTDTLADSNPKFISPVGGLAGTFDNTTVTVPLISSGLQSLTSNTVITVPNANVNEEDNTVDVIGGTLSLDSGTVQNSDYVYNPSIPDSPSLDIPILGDILGAISSGVSSIVGTISSGITSVVDAITGINLEQFGNDITEFFGLKSHFNTLFSKYLPPCVAVYVWNGFLALMAFWLLRLILGR